MKRLNKLLRNFTTFTLGILMVASCWLASHALGTTVLAASAASRTEPHQPQAQAQAQAQTEKVVFFGSSTTVGVGATRGDRRWSTLLAEYLGWEEYNESLSGSSLSKAPRTDKSWAIPAAVERWRSDILRRKPDRVVMLYGANDAFWKLPLGDETAPKPATYRGDAISLFSGLKTAFRPEQLIVITPQPNQATLDRRAPYDQVLATEAKRIGAKFIDAVTETFPSRDLTDFSADGLHLNNLGHAAFASALAGKLTDLGITAAPPPATGGSPLAHASKAIMGGYLRLDMAKPLSFGEIRMLSAHWVKPGKARLVVMRPDGRGGYNSLYRTDLFPVEPGTTHTPVPRWWVLEGDRLGVWTDTDALGVVPAKTAQHLSLQRTEKKVVTDIRPTEGKFEPYTLAVWVDGKR